MNIYWTNEWIPANWMEGHWSKRTLLSAYDKNNKRMKTINGNGLKNVIKISLWNLGARHWQRKKEEIEAQIIERDPCLLFISEANVMKRSLMKKDILKDITLYCPIL